MSLGREANIEQPSRKRWFLIALLVVLGFAILLYSRIDGRVLDRASGWLVDASAPALFVTNAVSRRVESWWVDFEAFLDGQSEVARLRRELEVMRDWRRIAENLEVENASLRALNNVNLPPLQPAVTAQIVAGPQGPFLNSVIVDAGAADGIRDGFPVVDGHGLVGRIVGIGKRASRILLLTDLSSRVPVLILPSGTQAILAGDGSDQPLLVLFADRTNITKGERVLTSGQGDIFAPGLPIGEVVLVDPGEIRISLFAQYNNLSFVRILESTSAPAIENPTIILPSSASRQSCECAPDPPRQANLGDDRDILPEAAATRTADGAVHAE